jgi:AGCS family alanine or glycine:cation symporter
MVTSFFAALDAVNAVTLSVPVLMTLLGVGILFTVWTRFCQYRSLTHGVALISGRGIATSHGDGVLTHFQALSAALSGTVGLGNIAGVAIAIQFGGPGAVFWMWVVGFAGMAIKSTEVMLAMLYRDTSDPANPSGGTMWVARNGLGHFRPGWTGFGSAVGALFALSLIGFAVTGGLMFQAWSVADTTRAYFRVPEWLTGLVLAVAVGAVVLGGIRRIGAITDKLVPLMCGIYVACGLYVLAINSAVLPEMFALILRCAFAPAEAGGAFMGAAFGTAFIFGMKRALFSSESGLGTAPIAHSAVKTPEPATESVVAGLEPFIDTLVVCTVTALVILSSGVWQRGPVGLWEAPPALVEAAPGQWQPATTALPAATGTDRIKAGDQVFVVADTGAAQRTRLYGKVDEAAGGIVWQPLAAAVAPRLAEPGLFADYPGSTLAARAFDTARPGLGQWMVTLTVWLFALSTMITYGYYGEQGMVYLFGPRSVRPFRVLWVALILVTCSGFITTAEQIDALSTVTMGFMLAINLPMMIVLGPQAMRAYRDYFQRLEAGAIRR